jgi:hypothetical protein
MLAGKTILAARSGKAQIAKASSGAGFSLRVFDFAVAGIRNF